jgi:hypothetical protein
MKSPLRLALVIRANGDNRFSLSAREGDKHCYHLPLSSTMGETGDDGIGALMTYVYDPYLVCSVSLQLLQELVPFLASALRGSTVTRH